MQRILTILYVILTGAFAVYTNILQIQPALFFIELSAPNPGDKYSLTFVFIIVWLILLLPLMAFLLILRAMRSKPQEIIGPERTGVFVTRQKSFQSAVVGIPVYINSKKVGIVDNGKTKFFDVPLGDFTVQAGNGKQASEKMEAKVGVRDQLNYEFHLTQDGLYTKIVLAETTKEDTEHQ